MIADRKPTCGPRQPPTSALLVVIVGVAAYDVIVARFRPQLKDLIVTIAVTLCYLALVLPLDIVWQENDSLQSSGTRIASLVLELTS